MNFEQIPILVLGQLM